MRTEAYVFSIILVLFVSFLLYFKFADHKTHIENDDFWREQFSGVLEDMEGISHDDDEWFYKSRPTCVAYGDWDAKCIRNAYYCPTNFIGNAKEQANRVKEAIRNGGVHPLCPLL